MSSLYRAFTLFHKGNDRVYNVNATPDSFFGATIWEEYQSAVMTKNTQTKW